MKLKTVLAAFLVLALLAACLPAAQKNLSDDAITDMVRRKLANDSEVKGGALNVEVKNGVVTLTGNVEREKQKQKADKLARKVPGVKQVNNQIRVLLPGK